MSKRKHHDDDNISCKIDEKYKIIVDDLTCLTCQKITNNVDSNINEFPWATQMKCTNCHDIWTICLICNFKSGRMNNLRSVIDHDRYCHKKTKSDTLVKSFPKEGDKSDEIFYRCIVEDVAVHSVVPDTKNSLFSKLKDINTSEIDFQDITSYRNKNFFQKLHNNTHIQGLISSSMNESHNESVDISDVDKSLHMSYCSLAYKLPPTDRHLLATLVSNVIAHTNSQKPVCNINKNEIDDVEKEYFAESRQTQKK